MSNTIAHLAVARQIIEKMPDLAKDLDAYFTGSVAPDTIGSKPECERNDKKQVHLRADIRDADWLTDEKMRIFNSRIREFSSRYINARPVLCGHRDFNIGYLVHLLTDKWNHKTIRQKMLQIANAGGISESDRAFYHMMVNDLEALDFYLFQNHVEIRELFARLNSNPVEFDLPGYIEKEYIEASMQWWKTSYLPNIETRKLLYISEQDINAFVELAAAEITAELTELIEKQ